MRTWLNSTQLMAQPSIRMHLLYGFCTAPCQQTIMKPYRSDANWPKSLGLNWQIRGGREGSKPKRHTSQEKGFSKQLMNEAFSIFWSALLKGDLVWFDYLVSLKWAVLFLAIVSTSLGFPVHSRKKANVAQGVQEHCFRNPCQKCDLKHSKGIE